MNSTVLPIRLKYAISQSSHNIKQENINNTYAKVKVQNIGDRKNVEIFYKKANGEWSSENMVLKANYGDYEIYTTKDIPLTEEFAFKYTVDGVEYWDSNYGNNYKLLTHRANNVMGGNVILNKALAKNDPEFGWDLESKKYWMEGEIYVRRKTSYNKRVGIKLTADNGDSWEEVEAFYEHPVEEGCNIDVALGELEVELWKFKTPVYQYNPKSHVFQFVVYYQNPDTGEFYWDNNFEQNYKLSKMSNSLLE
ncbi:MAG TPA: hypothetical protein V6D28_03475 [Leptolyngbyaceae cyanobacterium]